MPILNFCDISTHKYYVLDVNKLNKQEVISLLQKENKKYCESIYKIEYTQLFPDGINVKVYCNDEENIGFGMDDDNSSKLLDYIYENGITEKK